MASTQLHMKRFYLLIIVLLLAVTAVIGYHYFNEYWIHRYDDLIGRQAKVYRLDERLVWSVIYEETYFRACKSVLIKRLG